MLTLIHSNRLDPLEEALSQRLRESERSGLDPDVIVVPTSGVARWLKYRFTDGHGVCANVDFPYPAQFIWRMFSRVLPEVPASSPFDPKRMAWRLYGLLAELPQEPALRPLHSYLGRQDERGRYELAQRLASLFDQYLVYRPHWLEAWASGRHVAGDDEAWQAWLWRALLAELGNGHAAHPKEAFFERLQSGAYDPAALPARLSLFAIPLLPPLYLEIFAQLARFIHVDCYVLNPCREFWADIVSERELARMALAGEAQAAYRDVGHPLLASWGKQPRDNLALLSLVAGEENSADAEAFDIPDAPTLLAALQKSIVELSDLHTPASAADDASIQVHACHSLTRQLEVLHDRLLDLFERLPDLEPHQVVVMLPDLDAAAPLIEAVFGSVPRGRAIPFVVSGRSAPDASPLLRALDALLTLPASRFDAPALFDLLQTPAVARRFDLADDDLGAIRTWLNDAGVRWGRDAAHRAALGLPAESRHTWAEGLARLLLGYALPRGDEVFAGLLPCDEVEGMGALALGRLVRFAAALGELAEDLARPRRLDQWSALVAGLLDHFFEIGESEAADLERARAALAQLRAAAPIHRERLPLAVLRDAWRDAVASGAPGAVPSGSVVFCGVGPLRGLPYRVVCLLGMDDGAFPRAPAPVEFDLMARRPRLGDRARRDDDRGHFLDALMAARDVFYVSYNGRSQRDNAPLPPSILVSELLDYLGRCLPTAARAQLVIEHPLQAFSRRYFDGPLFSYAVEYCDAAQAAFRGGASQGEGRPLFAAPLPDAEDEWRRVRLDQLLRFFQHPVRFLLRERLRIRLEEAEEELADSEPFVLQGLAAWRLRDRLLELELAGRDEDGLHAFAAASGALPHGVIGEALLEDALRELRGFVHPLRAVHPPALRDPLPFEFDLGGFTLYGSLSGLHAAGRFGYRFARRSAFDLLSVWLHHLVLNHLAPSGVGGGSLWLNSDRLTRLPPVSDAASRLAHLLDCYWRGLHQPLPFFAKTAMALVIDGSESAARTCWAGTQAQAGERDDPWLRLAYGGAPEIPPEGFEDTARELLLPVAGLKQETEIDELWPEGVQ